MKESLKKLTLSFIITSIFSIGIYYIITFYDKSGTTMLFIKSNIQYLIFLYLSIIISLSLYNNKDKKAKLMLATIILINFLYIIFSFGIANIGLNNTQGLFLVGFLVLALVANYINNRFGYIITAMSILGIIFTIGFAIIPMYETGPDLTGFESQFTTKLVVYSKANINKSKASIKLDDKVFTISNGLSAYDLKINNSGSQLLFIADKKYLNSFGYLLFPNKDIIQIYPQSAINIHKTDNKYQIEIITGTIKQDPILNQNTGQNTNYQYTLTGEHKSFGLVNHENKSDLLEFYEEKQKEYILNKIGVNISKNDILTSISKSILTFLAKALPNQFKNNLENFNNFQGYINKDIDTQELIEFDKDSINKGIIKEISESLENTQIIK